MSACMPPRQFVPEPGPLADLPIPAVFISPGQPLHRPTGTEARLCADVALRQALGVRKYGCTVADNPLSLRQWLQHAYEEVLDQAVYLRRAIEQMDIEAACTVITTSRATTQGKTTPCPRNTASCAQPTTPTSSPTTALPHSGECC